MSDTIVKAVNETCLTEPPFFSKGTDVPRLLEQLDPITVAANVPISEHFGMSSQC